MALSSCEAEYIALKEAIKEQQYIKAILKEISAIYSPNTIEALDIYIDSNLVIELTKNPIYFKVYANSSKFLIGVLDLIVMLRPS